MGKFKFPLTLFAFGLISLVAYRLIPVCNPDIQTISYCSSVNKAGMLLYLTLIVSLVLAGFTAALVYANRHKAE